MLIVTPDGTVKAAAEVHAPPAVIVSPEVHVIAPEVALLIIKFSTVLVARLIV